MHTVAVIAGYLGAIVGVAMFVPQIHRTFRDRSVLGVSALAWALTGLSCFGWLLYGLRTGEMPQIPGNVFMVTGALVLVLSVPSTFAVSARAAAFGSAAGALIVTAIVAPPGVVGSFALSIGIVAAVPQVVRSLHRAGAAESAVSIPAWLLRAFSQVCWMIYGLLIGDRMVVVSTVLILSTAITLVGVELRRQRDAATQNAAVRLDQPAWAR